MSDIGSECLFCFLQKSPAVLQQGLFSKLHDRRLCDLFAPKNATGFSGVCEDLPRKCTQVPPEIVRI